MKSIFYDTHAHLDYPDFTRDFEQMIERASAAGITRMISVGTDFASSERAIQFSERHPGVFAAVGWHPTGAQDAPDDLRPRLRELARHPKVVAIGETGLDYYRLPSLQGGSTGDDESHKKKQAAIFEQQMEVAAELGLNCIVHTRESLDDAIAQMQPFAGRVRGVFHCFVDNPAAMRRVLAIGSLVSFTGIVTFRNAQAVRDTVVAVPADQFMLETDSPYLAPVPHRGKRCEPAYVKEIAELVAQLRGVTLDDLSRDTCATAERFFVKFGRS
jgi:TatD DNase family protein